MHYFKDKNFAWLEALTMPANQATNIFLINQTSCFFIKYL